MYRMQLEIMQFSTFIVKLRSTIDAAALYETVTMH